MIDLNQTEELTRAYLRSFNVALQETGNPNLATQVATAVIYTAAMVGKNNQPQISPMQFIAAALQQSMQETANEDRRRKERRAKGGGRPEAGKKPEAEKEEGSEE